MEDWFPWLVGGGTLLSVICTGASILCSVALPLVIVGGVFYLLRRSGKNMEAANKAAQAWPSTQGTIIKSRVEVSGGDYTSVSPRVIYRYEVHGQTYENDQLKAGWGATYSVHGRAYDVVDRYPEGATVTVYYNPDNPAESALER